MRKLFSFLLLAISISAVAQTNEELAQSIKANPKYLYGEGFGESQEDADQKALQNLISKISVNISSEFDYSMNEINHNGEIDSKTAANMVMKSYTQASLTNTKSIVVPNTAEGVMVVRYIEEAELGKIFTMRKEKMMDMVRSAQKSLGKLKIDDALRNYYWAFTLLKSLQYPNEVVYSDNGEDRKLINWIPEQMNDIFDDLEVRVAELDGNNAKLFFTYKEEPVRSLLFTFYNGNGWTMPNSAKNGVADIELRPGVDVNTLKIKYEYTGETQIDAEMQSVAKLFKETYFRKAETALAEDAKNLKSIVSKEAAKELATNNKATADISVAKVLDDKPYRATLKDVVKAIKTKDYNTIKPHFTEEGWDMMDRLLNYGKARILDDNNIAFYPVDDERVNCRSISMSFSFPNNHKTFTEDVTFTFNKDKIIESVAFGLGAEAKADIFDKGKGIWNDSIMLAIATFLENYKTAFALKRLEYIETIFDDNAVIITGHVVKKKPKQDNDLMSPMQINDLVKYTQYNKNEYIDHLRTSFKRNQFINLRFTDNDIVKMPGYAGEIYGIQIHQDYFSSNYGDTGYLFLIIDITDPNTPIIKVRTWQPERDPNINGNLPSSHPDYGILGPGNF